MTVKGIRQVLPTRLAPIHLAVALAGHHTVTTTAKATPLSTATRTAKATSNVVLLFGIP